MNMVRMKERKMKRSAESRIVPMAIFLPSFKHRTTKNCLFPVNENPIFFFLLFFSIFCLKNRDIFAKRRCSLTCREIHKTCCIQNAIHSIECLLPKHKATERNIRNGNNLNSFVFPFHLFVFVSYMKAI